MTNLLLDLRIALRELRRRPLFSLTAVLTLAIGMGVNTIAFTVVNGILFKGPAASVDGEVARVLTSPDGDEGGNASLDEFARFREATAGSLELAAEGRLSLAWRHDGLTETAHVLFVSKNYFSLLNVRPIAGQVLVESGTNGPAAVVIGERFWRRELGSAPLGGLTLRLNNTDAAVTGVLPESFTGPAGLYSPDVWLPLDDLAAFRTSPALLKRDVRWLFLLGRLGPGATVAGVRGQLGAAATAMARDWPDTHRQRGAEFRMLGERNGERRGLATAAVIAMGIIGLVLAIACFNVANLLLARAVDRERDMGIRAALGAGAGRLARLVLTEGCVIAALAGGAALLVARWTQSLVGAFAMPIETPQHIDLSPDGTVVAFVAGLVAIAGVLPGLWPALAAARLNLSQVLGSQGANVVSGRPSAMRPWLVGVQVAGSTAFLAIAWLLAQSYGHLSAADVGFDRDRLVLADVEPASHGYDAARAEQYAQAFAERVRALPGVADVALADRAPFFIGFNRLVAVATDASPCAEHRCPTFPAYAVGPGYFRTMGIALTAGREFERQSVPEVIVNQPLARQLWPDGGAIGRSVRLGDRGDLATVAGITARTHTRGLDRESPTIYLPLDRAAFEGPITIVARTAVPPDRLVRPIAEAAHGVDPDVSVDSVKTMAQRMAVQLWPFHVVRWLFSICGGLALVLATVGLAGVVGHSVSRRSREFGVRMSFGASPRDLVAEVLRSSARLLVPGLVIGTLLAAIGTRLLQFAFFGVDVLNPKTYLAVALLETTVVALACMGPALRAARVDPVVALRAE